MSFSESTDALQLRIGLHDHAVFVRLRVDGGDDALAEGVIQRVVDGGGGDAEARRGVAIDVDLRRQAGVGEIGRDIGELRRACSCASSFGTHGSSVALLAACRG